MKMILVLMDESEHLILNDQGRYYVCEDITLRKSNPIIAGTKPAPTPKKSSKKKSETVEEETYPVPSDEELFGTIPKEVEEEYGKIEIVEDAVSEK
jgi:hypothetical protein